MRAAPLVPMLFLAACSSSEPAVTTPPPQPAASDETCYLARYTEPCTMSAWELTTPDGLVTSVVRGPGSPNHLSSAVLYADNRYVVCGTKGTPVVDGECGEMPVFEARHFRILPPARQFVDCDLDGLREDCYRADDQTPLLMPARDPLVQEYEGVTLVREGDEYHFEPR